MFKLQSILWKVSHHYFTVNLQIQKLAKEDGKTQVNTHLLTRQSQKKTQMIYLNDKCLNTPNKLKDCKTNYLQAC